MEFWQLKYTKKQHQPLFKLRILPFATQSVIMALLTRASKLITESKDFKQKTEMLRHALKDDNYPSWF